MYDLIFIDSKIIEICDIDPAKSIRNMENVDKKYKNNLVSISKNHESNWDNTIYNDYCKQNFYFFLVKK